MSTSPGSESHRPATSAPGWTDVSLYGDDGPPWRGVSPRLATARGVVVSVAVLPVIAGLALVGWLLDAPVLYAGSALAGAGWLVALWATPRQVRAISWVEQGEELVIRKGRVFRRLVSIPYGRLQLADMQSGPVLRHFGLADVQIHTAAPRSGGTVPGLPLEEAEALRARLTERGESQRAGL